MHLLQASNKAGAGSYLAPNSTVLAPSVFQVYTMRYSTKRAKQLQVFLRRDLLMMQTMHKLR